MHRALIILMVASVAVTPRAVVAQSTPNQTYQSDTLGVSFQFPADWQISEQLPAHTVMAASTADLALIKAGNAPTGLLFTVTLTSFRLLGLHRVEDFTPYLQSIVGTAGVQAAPIKIGSAQGISLEVIDTRRNVASRTAIVSIGERRLAIVRGIATASGWTAAVPQLDQLLSSLVFTLPPHNDLDSYGQVLWQTPIDQLSEMVGIAASPDGSSVYVTGRTQGILNVSATGIPGAVAKPDGIAAFGGLGVLDNGSKIVADPANHTLWQIAPDSGKVSPLVVGKAGSGDGEFADQSPQAFAFGLNGILYVLDQHDSASRSRVEVFGRTGTWTATWDGVIPTPQGAPIQNPLISSDDSGNVYLLGSNTGGVIELSAAGKVIASGIGGADLANVTPLALTVDRAENLYVATADEGVLKLNSKGQLTGIIGEPFDEAAAPKPGQLGKPVALALADGDRLLYVADAGKHPQIVAFGLNGNYTLNEAAGTINGGTINFGQTVTGQITSTAFIVTYTFNAKANDVVTITMQPSGGSQLDPYVELIGQTISGTQIRLASNDDSGSPGLGPTDAQIKSYHIRFDAPYTLRATRFGGETTRSIGGYQLTLALEKPSGAKTQTFTAAPPSA